MYELQFEISVISLFNSRLSFKLNQQKTLLISEKRRVVISRVEGRIEHYDRLDGNVMKR